MTRKVFKEQQIIRLIFNIDIRQKYLSKSIEEIDNSQKAFEEKYNELKEVSTLVSNTIEKIIKNYNEEPYIK